MASTLKSLISLHLVISIFTILARCQLLPVEDPNFSTDGQEIGMVSAVDIDSDGDLYVFHRTDRPWTDDTFLPNRNVLSAIGKVPISKDTIFIVDPNTGRKKSSFGNNFFNIPHGLKIDANDTIWTTDVGRHQVFRFPKGATQPDLVLGEKFVPGDDERHFCKPADVTFGRNGEFFVADGYCNSRILKFSRDGYLLFKWGVHLDNATSALNPYTLNTPHSLTYIEKEDLICVADREHSRALCYNGGYTNGLSLGSYNRTLVGVNETGKVFAIYYNKAANEIVTAGEISREPFLVNGQLIYPPRAFSYSLSGQKLSSWANITQVVAKAGPSLIHDLCTSKDGQDVFLGDIVQHKVFKYTRRPISVVG
ncbi:unnamed protein product [Lymnaea stagnalis]|uniref:peptidylamidoglycolate lyase n=1 Tax=Lymnaea stagnalis TaxID=6523 RepID=A0AAV2HMW5_LYMST